MPAMTAQSIIQDALEDLGVYDPGDQVSAADEERSLFVLNVLIDELAAENIFIYAQNSETIPVVIGTSVYTIGPGGNINTYRPDRITYGPNASSIVVTAVSTPVNCVSALEFQSLQAYNPDPGLPDTLWYNPTYPLGTLTILPEPSVSGNLTFEAWQRIVSFANSTTSYNLAAGVTDSLCCNLAVALKPYFMSANLDPAIAARATVSRAFLALQGTTSRAMLNRYPASPINAAAPQGNR